MSINRDRLAGLMAVLALLATGVLPGSAAAAPPVAQAPGRQAAQAPGRQVARGAGSPVALVATPPAALAAGSQTVAAPVSVGSWLGAAPGALGATTGGTGVVGAGTAETAYGLDRPGHRTSARDLARLWEVAMRRADFRALVSTRSAQLPGPARVRKFTNTNQLLGSYAWAVGGKTGFTNDAKRCLVASASRGGRRLVAVALGSPDAFADVRALFEYGFTAFDWVRLARRGQAVTLAGTGQTAAYQVTADVDALVRQDLLDELALAPPTRILGAPSAPAATAGGTASTTGGAASSTAPTAAGGTPSAVPGSGGTLTVWIQAGGQRLAPLRLGPPGSAPASGSGTPGAVVASGPAAAGGAASDGSGAQGDGSTPGEAIPPLSSVAAGLVPPGSVPAAIDPFLRRASP